MQASRVTRVLRYERRGAADAPGCAASRAARVAGCRIAGGKHGGQSATSYLGRCEYPRSPESVAKARDTMRKALAEWGLSSLTDDVVLCVSEAVTNSIRHARASFRTVTLTAWRSGDTVHVEVIDGDRHRPKRTVPLEAGLMSRLAQGRLRDSGRGIYLISRFSTRWGVAPRPPGKRVWFEFDTEPMPCAPSVPG